MTATVTCRKCGSIVCGDLCDICGAPPMILPPRLPPPARPPDSDTEASQPIPREAARKREEDLKWIEEYRRTHPGTSAYQAAMALVQHRAGKRTVFHKAVEAIPTNRGRGQ